METEITTNPEQAEDTKIISEGPNYNKKKIIALVVTFAMICGVVYGYTVLDVLKSPKQIYLEAERTNLLQINKQLKNAYEEYYNNYAKLYEEKPVHNNVEMTLSLKAPGTDNYEIGLMNIFLQQCKLLITSASDEKQGIGYANINLNIANNNLIGLDYLVSREKIGMAVPALYDKYLYVNFAEREILQEKFGLEGIPRKIVSNKYYKKVFTLTPQEKKLFAKYGKLYADCLNEEQISLEEGTFSAEKRQINCRKITVSFNHQQISHLARIFAETMAQDEPLLELVCSKQQQLLQLCYDSGYNMESLDAEKLDKNKLKEALNSFKDRLSSGEGNSSQLIMTLYVDSRDNILDRQITIGEKDSGALVRTACWTNQEHNTQGLFLMQSLDEAEPGELRFEYTGKKIDSKATGGQIVMIFADEVTDDKFVIDYTHSKEGDQEHFTADFTLFSSEDNTNISGNLQSDLTFNKKDKKRDGVTSFTLNLDGISPEMQNMDLILNFKHSEEFNEPVELPTLDHTNSQNLADMTEEDLARLKLQLEANMQKLMLDNYGIFQSL